MSRIGKLPVVLPQTVKLNQSGSHLTAEGPKGSLDLKLPKGIKIDINEQSVVVHEPTGSTPRAYWGLARTLVANLVQGVNEGFSKQLEIQGVGYRAQTSEGKISLSLGYSHSIEYDLPDGVTAQIEGNIMTISGVDKQQVGQVAAELRSLRPPEPYKGKGIRYVGEVVRRKVGKAAGKAAA